MLTEYGKVSASKDDTLEIILPRTKACATCKACGFMTEDGDMLLYAENLCGARTGDTVQIEIRESSRTKAALLLYALPLLVFMASLFTAHSFLPEWGALLTSVVATLLTYLLLYVILKKVSSSDDLPRAVRVISASKDT